MTPQDYIYKLAEKNRVFVMDWTGINNGLMTVTQKGQRLSKLSCYEARLNVFSPRLNLITLALSHIHIKLTYFLYCIDSVMLSEFIVFR